MTERNAYETGMKWFWQQRTIKMGMSSDIPI